MLTSLRISRCFGRWPGARRQILLRGLAGQVYDALPDGAQAEIGKFLQPWRASTAAVTRAGPGAGSHHAHRCGGGKRKSFDGRSCATRWNDGRLQGTTGVYHFSATNHQGITENPLLLTTIVNGKCKS